MCAASICKHTRAESVARAFRDARGFQATASASCGARPRTPAQRRKEKTRCVVARDPTTGLWAVVSLPEAVIQAAVAGGGTESDATPASTRQRKASESRAQLLPPVTAPTAAKPMPGSRAAAKNEPQPPNKVTQSRDTQPAPKAKKPQIGVKTPIIPETAASDSSSSSAKGVESNSFGGTAAYKASLLSSASATATARDSEGASLVSTTRLHDLNKSSTPTFPSDYVVALSMSFKSKGSTSSGSFVVYELHVASSSASSNGGGRGGGGEVETPSLARVYVHSGTFSASSKAGLSGREQVYDCLPVHKCQLLLAELLNRAENRGFVRAPLLSTALGSKHVSKPSRGGSGSGGETSEAPATQAFVSLLFAEASSFLGAHLKVTVSDAGLAGPLGVPTQTAIETGQGLAASAYAAFCRHEASAVKEYYRALADCVPLATGQPPTSVAEFEALQDALQLMRDLVAVDEGRGGGSVFGSALANQLAVLGCSVRFVGSGGACGSSGGSDSGSELAGMVPELVAALTAPTNGPRLDYDVVAAYAVQRSRGSRPLLRNGSSPGNRRLLFHGSRLGCGVGLLSRGLLLPNTVVSKFRGARSDYGRLGAGIYFSDSLTSVLKYTHPSDNDAGLSLVIACEVELGHTYETANEMPELIAAPAGYDSVRSLARAAESSSVFDDDEFVVYHTCQVAVAYALLIRSEASLSQRPQKPLVSVQDLVAAYCANASGSSSANGDAGGATRAALREASQPSRDRGGGPEMELALSDPHRDDAEPPSPATGLVATDASGAEVALPLRAVSVRGKLLDTVATVVVMQQFHNTSDGPLEARFVFPLDEMCAVCGFEAFINGKHIIGVVKEKEEARREYREAIERGDGAYLMEEESGDVFSVSVGNLPPGAKVLIKIRYVTELGVDGDSIVFNLPARVAPSPAKEAALHRSLQSTTASVADAGGGSNGAAAPLDLELALDMPYEILSIRSVRHPIRTRRTATKATIALAPEAAGALSDDFCLLVELERPHEPRMWVETNDAGHAAVMLCYYPDLGDLAAGHPAGPATAYEISLLLDCSASMADCFDDARAAAGVALCNLPRDGSVAFNVVPFGSAAEPLFVGPVPSSPANLRKALGYVSRLTPTLGGTDLYSALNAVFCVAAAAGTAVTTGGRSGSGFATSAAGGRGGGGSDGGPPPRQSNVLVISDGQVVDEESTLGLVATAATHTRTFVLGIGDSPARHVLRSLARVGGGVAEVLATPFAVHKTLNSGRVVRQLRRSLEADLRDVAVEFIQTTEKGAIVQAPSQINSVYEGERLIVYGFVDYCASAKLSARAADGTYFETRVDAHGGTTVEGSVIHALAARAMVRDYETGSLSTDRVAHEAAKYDGKAAVIDLGIRYSLVTPYTSFVAIEERTPGEAAVDEYAPPLAEIVACEAVDELDYVGWEDVEPVVEFDSGALIIAGLPDESEGEDEGGIPVAPEVVEAAFSIGASASDSGRSTSSRSGGSVTVEFGCKLAALMGASGDVVDSLRRSGESSGGRLSRAEFEDAVRRIRLADEAASVQVFAVDVPAVDARGRKKKGKVIPSALVIGKDVVMVVSNDGKTASSYPLTHLRRWAASTSSFTLDFGDYEDTYTSVATDNGEAISACISSKIDVILKRQRAASAHDDADGAEGGESVTEEPLRRGSAMRPSDTGRSSLSADSKKRRNIRNMVSKQKRRYREELRELPANDEIQMAQALQLSERVARKVAAAPPISVEYAPPLREEPVAVQALSLATAVPIESVTHRLQEAAQPARVAYAVDEVRSLVYAVADEPILCAKSVAVESVQELRYAERAVDEYAYKVPRLSVADADVTRTVTRDLEERARAATLSVDKFGNAPTLPTSFSLPQAMPTEAFATTTRHVPASTGSVASQVLSGPATTTTTSSAARSGASIDPSSIEVARVLGQGSFGKVSLGLMDGEQVVIKSCHCSSEEEAEALIEAVEYARNLFHDGLVGVVGILGSYSGGTAVSVVTEYVAWPDCSSLLLRADDPLPLRFVLKLSISLAEAFAFLHSLSPPVVLVDLSLSDVFVDVETGDVRLGSFLDAVARARTIHAGKTPPSPGMSVRTAPELLGDESGGSANPSPKADMYTFGLVLYTLAVREEPFADTATVAVFMRVLKGERPSLPTGLYEPLRALIVDCWAGDPALRPSARAALRRLELMAGSAPQSRLTVE